MTDQTPMQVDVNAVLAEMQNRIGALIQENAVLTIINRNLTTALAESKQRETTNS